MDKRAKQEAVARVSEMAYRRTGAAGDIQMRLLCATVWRPDRVAIAHKIRQRAESAFRFRMDRLFLS